MTEQEQETPQKSPASVAMAERVAAKQPPTLKEFLEKCPPDIELVVTDRVTGPYRGGDSGQRAFFKLLTPELDLYCENCDGTRAFRFRGEYATVLSKGLVFEELDYECKNCKEGNKFQGEANTGPAQKIGEYPAYSPVTSRKVYDLIGENHREMFLKGRRAELRGLGIGAFAYYRRIVDDQKDLIVDQLEKVAKRLGVNPDVLKLFTSAKAEDQFTNAIKQIKDALPPALFISGHNPLTILYDVLSDGIHDLSDQECLAYARTVRTLLIALADRISEISKDEAKVKEAIGAFLTRKQTK
jgi:hypothetical protein